MKEISRRQFLKIFGGATVASSTLLTACKNKDQSEGAVKEPPKDKMTYRVNPNTNEKVSFEVSGDKIEAVHMIPGWTHNIINLSDTENLVTLMWANEQFDPNHPDTFFEPI